jgi:hypothetical protein
MAIEVAEGRRGDIGPWYRVSKRGTEAVDRI